LDSTDPRDKIYGLAAFTEHVLAESGSLQPDYHVPVEELYILTAKKIIEDLQHLNILSIPRKDHGSVVGKLPSWVPDWTNTALLAPLGLANYSDINDLPYAASGTVEPHIHLNANDTALVLEGHFVDRIAAVGTVLETTNMPRSNYQSVRIPKVAFRLREWVRVAQLARIGPYVSGESMTDSFGKTLTAGTCKENDEVLRTQIGILENFEKIASWMVTIPNFAPEWLKIKIAHFLKSFFFWNSTDEMTLNFRFSLSSLGMRRVFRTEKGYIGLVPSQAEVGDSVFVVKGGKVPLVLRRASRHDGEESWELRSDCYLHGIMHGEAFDETKCGRVVIT
jgi:hypothetical protein